MEAAKKKGVKRFIYSASSSIYGDQEKLPLIETISPNLISPYALQKLTGEYYCKLYNLLFGIETISLRYFNVYGPRQDSSTGLIPKTINLILNNLNPEIYGNGEQTRDFVYVKDVIEANILAATTNNKKIFGESFNVGSGNSLSVNNVVKDIINIIGNKTIKPKYKPPVVEPKDTIADIAKIRNMLKWQPRFNFKKGIRETIDWFRNKHAFGN